MSMAEKNRHLTHAGVRTRNGESRAHSAAHRYDSKKFATVVNHTFYERHHGFESTHHKEKHPHIHP